MLEGARALVVEGKKRDGAYIESTGEFWFMYRVLLVDEFLNYLKFFFEALKWWNPFLKIYFESKKSKNFISAKTLALIFFWKQIEK